MIDSTQLLANIVPIMCIWREASGEGADGMTAVAWVIQNRANRRKLTPRQVCLQPWQFSSMNAPSGDPGMTHWPTPGDDSFEQACGIWSGVQSNSIADPTQGADLYYATTIPAPVWTGKARFLTQIGRQRFYKDA